MFKKLPAWFSRQACGRSVAIFLSGFQLCLSVSALINHDWMMAVAGAIWAIAFQVQVASSKQALTIVLRTDEDQPDLTIKAAPHVTH